MNPNPDEVFPGLQPSNRSYWFGHVGASGPVPAGSFPVTPSELDGRKGFGPDPMSGVMY